MKFTLGLCTFLVTTISSNARPTFVARIPNGNGVTGVAALGHVNTFGGGATNVFGEAFESAGHEWTKELCQADSDRDGASNGEELGDPCCTWTAVAGFNGASSSLAQASVTHPGVANSFTESQLATMTCSGEADLDVVTSSEAVSSISSISASGSQPSTSSRIGDSSSTSGSLDNVMAPEDQSRDSPDLPLDQASPAPATSDAQQLKAFVCSFSIAALALAAS